MLAAAWPVVGACRGWPRLGRSRVRRLPVTSIGVPRLRGRRTRMRPPALTGAGVSRSGVVKSRLRGRRRLRPPATAGAGASRVGSRVSVTSPQLRSRRTLIRLPATTGAGPSRVGGRIRVSGPRLRSRRTRIRRPAMTRAGPSRVSVTRPWLSGRPTRISLPGVTRAAAGRIGVATSRLRSRRTRIRLPAATGAGPSRVGVGSCLVLPPAGRRVRRSIRAGTRPPFSQRAVVSAALLTVPARFPFFPVLAFVPVLALITVLPAGRARRGAGAIIPGSRVPGRPAGGIGLSRALARRAAAMTQVAIPVVVLIAVESGLRLAFLPGRRRRRRCAAARPRPAVGPAIGIAAGGPAGTGTPAAGVQGSRRLLSGTPGIPETLASGPRVRAVLPRPVGPRCPVAGIPSRGPGVVVRSRRPAQILLVLPPSAAHEPSHP
jgi:hypothetical protein